MRVVLLHPCKKNYRKQESEKVLTVFGFAPLDRNPLELKSVESGSLSSGLPNLNNLSKSANVIFGSFHEQKLMCGFPLKKPPEKLV